MALKAELAVLTATGEAGAPALERIKRFTFQLQPALPADALLLIPLTFKLPFPAPLTAASHISSTAGTTESGRRYTQRAIALTLPTTFATTAIPAPITPE